MYFSWRGGGFSQSLAAAGGPWIREEQRCCVEAPEITPKGDLVSWGEGAGNLRPNQGARAQDKHTQTSPPKHLSGSREKCQWRTHCGG